jgi:NAD(P)-dependent dehydrogenase (short-subunit alcohol dehydrogenase family)
MAVDNFSLSGKVAIVTGSGRENGIGAAIARALARNGAFVTINYVSPSTASRAEAVANEIRSTGGKAIVVGADVSTAEGADKIAQETLKGFGTDHIDILGMLSPVLLQKDDESDFSK